MNTTVMPEPSTLNCIIERFDTEADWLQARRSLIGASDTAGIFGCGYSDQSAATVWDSKLRPAEAPDPAKLKRFKIGKLMEPTLRAIFAEETGMPCESLGAFTLCRHPTLAWLGASLDGLTVHPEYGPSPVELKNVSGFNKSEWKDDDAPLKYSVQVQHQLVVTGATHGFLLGLIGGNEPIIKTIPRNDRFCDAMLARLEEFWGYVQRRELPPVDASIATGKLLASLYPRDTGATVFLPPESSDWDRDLEGAKAAIKAAEQIKVAAENKIKAAIQSATFGEVPGGVRYSLKTQERAEYVCKATSFRVLRRAG